MALNDPSGGKAKRGQRAGTDCKREIIDAVRQDCKGTIWRARAALHCDRSTCRYQFCHADPAFFQEALSEEICETHVRAVCPRLRWDATVGELHPAPRHLARGHEEGLPALRSVGPPAAQQDSRGGSRRSCARTGAALWPNNVRAMDFVHNHLATGRKLRILTAVDIFSGPSLVVDPRFSYRGADLVAALDHACRKISFLPHDGSSCRHSRDLCGSYQMLARHDERSQHLAAPKDR